LSGSAALGMLLALLVSMALFVPLLMTYWFAPALVAINGLNAIDAMKASFLGCAKNWVPFLVYGLVGLIVIVAFFIVMAVVWLVSRPFVAIPLGILAWLALFAPTVMASIYTSYRDVYYDE
jgi:hypothetical protein